MQDSGYHMTPKSHFIRDFHSKRLDSDICKRDVIMDITK